MRHAMRELIHLSVRVNPEVFICEANIDARKYRSVKL